MLVGPRNLLRQHWLWVLVIALSFASAWALQRSASLGRTFGATPAGLVLGVAAAGVIVFEVLLWPRRRLRAWRNPWLQIGRWRPGLGSARTWMRAHIWLGLLSVPLVGFHSGWRWGGLVSTSLLVVFYAVVLSGVIVLVLQNVLPRRLWKKVERETICEEIPQVSRRLAETAEEIVARLCGRSRPAPAADEKRKVRVLGAGREPLDRVDWDSVPTGPVAGAEDAKELSAEFENSIRPYLLHGGARAGADRSASLVKLRSRLDARAHAGLDAIQALCDERAQLDIQARLHRRLHFWLACVHLPLSLVLLLILAAHVVVALRYM